MGWMTRLRLSRFPLLALACLGVLLGAALVIGGISERAQKAQLERQAGAQADLLASAVSGALAFDDASAAQDYVDAVQVNPGVISAGVFNTRGERVASFSRPGEAVPASGAATRSSSILARDELLVVRPVLHGGQRLGEVELRLMNTAPAERFSRYADLLVVLSLAGLVVGVLAVAQAALRRANATLAERAEALAQANASLEHQMAEREKAEAALRQSQKMEAIGRLTGGVAHDFNNLLMAASSGIELLDRTEDPARRKALSDGVRHAVERGAALTKQLLAFSRRAPLKSEVMDVGARLQGMRMLLERSLREDIQVYFEVPEGLWPIEADPGEFELAILNLAVNARDAMPAGGRLTVHARNASTPTEGEAVEITLSDTGGGIPETVLPQIFEPFFTTKTVGRGTGLGLSQVYGFARSSGGEVRVVSRQGEGAAFTLMLPRSEKDIASEPAEASPAEASAASGRGSRVLLVEDDDAVAAGVGHMLRDLGYDYVRAPEASMALKLLASGEEFDLVLSDMIMPGEMDGLALGMEVRKNYPSLPIVLMTGFSEAASSALAARFPLLQKPYGLPALQAALADAEKSRES